VEVYGTTYFKMLQNSNIPSAASELHHCRLTVPSSVSCKIFATQRRQCNLHQQFLATVAPTVAFI